MTSFIVTFQRYCQITDPLITGDNDRSYRYTYIDELLLPLDFKELTKTELWKVKDILKNSCSWNSKIYHVLEFQEHLYSSTPLNVYNFQKHPPIGVPWK